jgi:hypothetical protein
MDKDAVSQAIDFAANMIKGMDAEQKEWFSKLSSDEQRRVICAGLAASAGQHREVQQMRRQH